MATAKTCQFCEVTISPESTAYSLPYDHLRNFWNFQNRSSHFTPSNLCKPGSLNCLPKLAFSFSMGTSTNQNEASDDLEVLQYKICQDCNNSLETFHNLCEDFEVIQKRIEGHSHDLNKRCSGRIMQELFGVNSEVACISLAGDCVGKQNILYVLQSLENICTCVSTSALSTSIEPQGFQGPSAVITQPTEFGETAASIRLNGVPTSMPFCQISRIEPTVSSNQIYFDSQMDSMLEVDNPNEQEIVESNHLTTRNEKDVIISDGQQSSTDNILNLEVSERTEQNHLNSTSVNRTSYLAIASGSQATREFNVAELSFEDRRRFSIYKRNGRGRFTKLKRTYRQPPKILTCEVAECTYSTRYKSHLSDHERRHHNTSCLEENELQNVCSTRSLRTRLAARDRDFPVAEN